MIQGAEGIRLQIVDVELSVSCLFIAQRASISNNEHALWRLERPDNNSSNNNDNNNDNDNNSNDIKLQIYDSTADIDVD